MAADTGSRLKQCLPSRQHDRDQNMSLFQLRVKSCCDKRATAVLETNVYSISLIAC